MQEIEKQLAEEEEKVDLKLLQASPETICEVIEQEKLRIEEKHDKEEGKTNLDAQPKASRWNWLWGQLPEKYSFIELLICL